MGIETIGWIFTVIISPFITQLLKKYDIANQFSTAVNAAIACILYLSIWYVTTGHNPELFQGYFTAALAAAGIGSAGFNLLKSGSRLIMNK